MDEKEETAGRPSFRSGGGKSAETLGREGRTEREGPSTNTLPLPLPVQTSNLEYGRNNSVNSQGSTGPKNVTEPGPGPGPGEKHLTFAPAEVTEVEAGRSGTATDMSSSTAIRTNSKFHRHILTNQTQSRKFIDNSISSGKYSILSFPPKFFYEQFRRYSNVFFLSISILQQIPNVSPSGRWTTIIPFIFILAVSALKEILEDIKRHKSDNATNNKEVEVFEKSNPVPVAAKWSDIQVGDFVKIHDDQAFPCDLVLYSSSDPTGICYVETSNLDGETNLKIRQALPSSAHIKDEDVPHILGYITCEEPNALLYEFLGKVSLDGKTENPLGPDQILLRGSKLQNTQWIIGQAIYTGHETKLMKNANQVPLKQSTVDKITNKQIFLLFLLLMATGITCSSLCMWWTAHVGPHKKMWYLPEPDIADVSYAFIFNFFTFVILFNSIIPISLTVTLEMVRFIQATFINKDLDMYYEESDIPAVAKTSNLNEELGIIRYIFSDKTGTLTQNVMEFKGCSISGVKFPPEVMGEGGDASPLMGHITSKSDIAEDVRDFLTILAVCHTVIPDLSTGELVYHASSPDERALVMGAKKYGFDFDSRTPQTVTIIVTIGGVQSKEVYDILNILDFTSDRKRMSVVVRRPNGKLTIFCKGADMMVFDRMSEDLKVNSAALKSDTDTHLSDFSKLGLRTLCIALRELSAAEYMEWNRAYQEAQVNLSEKATLLAALGEEIETNLRLIGATAIEDKLQDKVPETISALLKAGINIWVLTGDKQETAINIGRSCNLLKPDMRIYFINQHTKMRTFVLINNYLAKLRLEYGDVIPENVNAAVVIDGKTLHFATSRGVKEHFIQLCTACRVVICCRASPFQKAEIVSEVTIKTGKVTLAIGDGANDVAMIQKAHVGVGIAGLEGLQAASSSDYSIGQIFTAFQPLALGLFEKNVRAEMRMKFPKLYTENQSSFSTKVFMLWMGVGLFQSVVSFSLSSYVVGDGILWSHGRDGGYLILGKYINTGIIFLVSLKAGIELKGWTSFAHFAIWGSILTWFIFIVAYALMGEWELLQPLGADIVGIPEMIFTSFAFWLIIPIIVIVSYIPELCFHVIKHAMGEETEEERRRQEDVILEQQDSGEKLVLEAKSTTAQLNAIKSLSNANNADATTATDKNGANKIIGAVPDG